MELVPNLIIELARQTWLGKQFEYLTRFRLIEAIVVLEGTQSTLSKWNGIGTLVKPCIGLSTGQ
jgi:hypothetical protein